MLRALTLLLAFQAPQAPAPPQAPPMREELHPPRVATYGDMYAQAVKHGKPLVVSVGMEAIHQLGGHGAVKMKNYSTIVVCPDCNGDGVVVWPKHIGGGTIEVRCPKCDGTGKIDFTKHPNLACSQRQSMVVYYEVWGVEP